MFGRQADLSFNSNSPNLLNVTSILDNSFIRLIFDVSFVKGE